MYRRVRDEEFKLYCSNWNCKLYNDALFITLLLHQAILNLCVGTTIN